MNPIYTFYLQCGVNGQDAHPIYGDDFALVWERASGERYIRKNISGDLTFLKEDYDFILSCPFDAEIVLKIYESADGTIFDQIWEGGFYRTDCQIDMDDNMVVVAPQVKDVYSQILEGMEKEFDLIKLAPEITPIKMDKRPLVQVYIPGTSVVGCMLSGMYWEQECAPESDYNRLTNYYHFDFLDSRSYLAITGAVNLAMFTWSEQGYVFEIDNQGTPDDPDYHISLERTSDGAIWEVYQSDDTFPFTLTAKPGTSATGTVTVTDALVSVYARYLTDKSSIPGATVHDIPSDDIVADNKNYHYVVGYGFSDTVFFSNRLTSTPTEWGQAQPGVYYLPPYLGPGQPYTFLPVASLAWGMVSVWIRPFEAQELVEELGRTEFVLKDAYPLHSAISVLLGQIAPGISFSNTTDYSDFLYNSENPLIPDYAGYEDYITYKNLAIAPKSNIINSNYNQAAQKAPITLRSILDMLRDCFRCYWYIDSANRFRIEHISFFMNGLSYSSTPSVGVDLTDIKYPRTKKPWAFGQNKYSFDKNRMPSRFEFGWMDDVSDAFEGWPINILSGYIDKSLVEKIEVRQFTSDSDYLLLNPSQVSRDGFALLAPVEENGELVLPYVTFVRGDLDIITQNGLVAFAFLEGFYAWDLPGEDYEINGATETAIDIKRTKIQEVEFPSVDDVNVYKTVKTGLSPYVMGEIRKVSITLSSRGAKATLEYPPQ